MKRNVCNVNGKHLEEGEGFEITETILIRDFSDEDIDAQTTTKHAASLKELQELLERKHLESHLEVLDLVEKFTPEGKKKRRAPPVEPKEKTP